ncbi:M14 family zinc carboxypeptidase [Kutzneria sp. NPDC052558]|uniref:M14 family zinc carboxypeptidase n=1 Tax=Kutzneria sp. NPDC052558 TaxID=3364121 RepID=UPI0037CAE34A
MRHRALIRIAAGVAALLLVGSASAAAGDDTPVMWSVPITGDQVNQLVAAGFDVAETGGDGVAYVTGTNQTAQALRDLGYRPTEFDTIYKELPAQRSLAAGTFYGGYRTVTSQEQHLGQVADAHPDLATVYDIGDSWLKTKGRGGHDIEAICLTKKKTGDCALSTTSAKPKFTLIAQIHAREISTGELAWRWIDYLANGYGSDATATSILDTTEIWVIPIANPDGVDAVASGGNSPKMQRKNEDNSHGSCTGTDVGIDLNRNSTFKWGTDSNAPCDETYQGPSKGSEPEVTGLEKFFRSIYPVQRGSGDNDPAPVTARGTMITMHSYGNDIIIPWGWNNKPSPNDAQYRVLGKKMAASNGYVVDTNGGTVGYETPGTTDDFTYGTLGVASFTIEVGSASGTCGGFFPKYSCVDSKFWPDLKGAFIVAAQAAAAPYKQ